jgi:hypothetical protein
MTLSPKDLQKIKTDLYKEIKFDRKTQTGTLAVEETQKALARTAREKLEEVAPGIEHVNRRWGNLEELEPYWQRASGRIAQRDDAGIGMDVNAAGAGMIGGPAAAAAGAVRGWMDRPFPKFRRSERFWEAEQPGFMLTPQTPWGLGMFGLSQGLPYYDEGTY